MFKTALLVVLSLKCFASLVVQQHQPQSQPLSSELRTTGYAVDLSLPASLSVFQCMKRSLYNVVFIRAYSPAGQGRSDPYVISNIHNAFEAGLGTEIYMTPQPHSDKSGTQQFDEMYYNLKNAHINVRSVWIQITSPINWFPSTLKNVAFINEILNRANMYGLKIGIYTNFYDWSQITNSAVVNNVMLWYWNVYGSGLSNESSANFTDFRAFGGWTAPSVKQFGQAEFVCNTVVNRDVYSNEASTDSVSMNSSEKLHEIRVGGLGLLSAVLAGQAEIKL